jgi:hypothetical protein
MSRKTIAPSIDPTLPKVEVTLDGKKLYLCFTFTALANAEARLREVGTRVNLLHALDLTDMHAEQVVPLLYAALLTHQPTIDPVTVAKLVTFRSIPAIYKGITDAYLASLTDSKSEESANPDEPQAN